MGFYRQQKGLLMIHTKDQIAEAMKLIPALTEDEIVDETGLSVAAVVTGF